MSAASERRALLLEANDDYDPFLTVDVNEYLIEHYPTLTAKIVNQFGIFAKMMMTLTMIQFMIKLMIGFLNSRMTIQMSY